MNQSLRGKISNRCRYYSIPQNVLRFYHPHPSRVSHFCHSWNLVGNPPPPSFPKSFIGNPPPPSFPKSFIGNPSFCFFFGFQILWTPRRNIQGWRPLFLSFPKSSIGNPSFCFFPFVLLLGRIGRVSHHYSRNFLSGIQVFAFSLVFQYCGPLIEPFRGDDLLFLSCLKFRRESPPRRHSRNLQSGIQRLLLRKLSPQ